MKMPAVRLPKKFNWQGCLLLVVAIFFAIVIGIFSFFTFRQFSIFLIGSGKISAPAFNASQTTPVVNAQGTPLIESPPGSSSMADITTSLTPWDGAGRVTVLLLGLDYRDWVANEGPPRSDTMILLTLDPLAKTAGILSVPRDLWATIPGFKNGKINTAYMLGEAYKLPAGGPGLAVKTVEQLLGVPINYYAQIDFEAFVKFIDELEGVLIDVPAPITIDLLGSGGVKTKKKLEPGKQVLPGEWALAYARARNTEGGDFDRAQRQQQVIMAIRQRILNKKMLPTLISKAPTLYNQLASGIHTNLALDDALKLSLLAKDIPEENIKRGAIGEEQVYFATSPDNLSILIPIPDKINLLRDQIFTSTGLGPAATGTYQEKMQAEGAKIAIYDGVGNTDLLNRTAEYLRKQGANVVQMNNADKNYNATTVVDHTGNPHALNYLVDLFKISKTKIRSAFDPINPIDVEIYLGSDWVQNPQMP